MPSIILFVDDEPEFIMAHKTGLINAGYSVENAFTYEEAELKLEQSEFDLIILDLILSSDHESLDNGLQVDVSKSEADVEIGMQLHREIRKNQRLTKIPILFFTVVADAEVRGKIDKIERASGMQLHFLTKPQLPSKLIAEVKNIIPADLR